MERVDRVRTESSYNRDSVVGLAKLRAHYFYCCIPQLLKFGGFGSRGRMAFLDVVAARLNLQYVLETTEAIVVATMPHLFGEAQVSFMTFLREEWWPVFQVLASGPYTTFGLNQSERNEFFSHHVVRPWTQQSHVYTPPTNGKFLDLEQRRMYTIYKQVQSGQHQILFGKHQRYYTHEEELASVFLPRDETVTFNNHLAITKNLIEYLAHPYEQLLRNKKVDELDAALQMQADLDYVVNHEDMVDGVNRAIEDVASLPTFEERAARAEQLQKVCIMARVRLRLSAEQVRLTTTARHEHEHMVLQVYDLIDEASRCLEQDDVERAYELVKAVQVYLPHVPRRSDNAQRLIIPCLVLPQVTQGEQQYYSGRTGTGGPLDVAVGIDSDSAITATTNRNYCVRINTGSSFLHNASVTGVGGEVCRRSVVWVP